MYKVIYSIGWLLALLPLRLLYLFADIIAFLVYRCSLYRMQVTLENLRKAFPEKSEEEIRKIARKFYRHFADQVMESFKMLHLNEKQILKRVNYTNPELLDKLYESGRSVIAVTAHFGTWEWLVSLPLVTRHKVLIVYKPPSNKGSHFVYKIFQGKYGGISVELPRLPRTLLEYRAKNKPTATFLVNDQSPVREHISYWTTFLNQDTPVQTALERLVRKFGQAVVFIQVNMKKRGRCDVTFHELPDDLEQVGPNGISEAFMRKLEQMIRDDPALWLWTHRRWKLVKP
jgi:KDO2-lipid IV(A) lauroyltransferase